MVKVAKRLRKMDVDVPDAWSEVVIEHFVSLGERFLPQFASKRHNFLIYDKQGNGRMPCLS